MRCSRRQTLRAVGLSLAFVMLAACSGAPKPAALGTRLRLQQVKMINYYPSRHPWAAMWTHWDASTLDHDFGVIAGLHANSVRLILQPDAFGFPAPTVEMLHRLSTTVDLAAKHGLHVQLTLFDLWSRYVDLAGSEGWARAIIAPFRSDKRVQSIELKNEVDGSDEVATRWATRMIPFVRDVVGDVPITISSLSAVANLAKLKRALATSPPDFFSFHYYGTAAVAVSFLRLARDVVAPTPLVVGETGFASGSQSPGAPPDRLSELAQRDFIEAVERAAAQLGLPPAAPWQLEDLAAGTAAPQSPLAEYHFGLFRTDGSAKPAAIWLRAYFAARM